MFALGNELSGKPETMAALVTRFRQADPRHLYAHGSNNFIWEPQPGLADAYWTIMMTGGHYRAGDFKPDSKGREVRGSFCVHTHGHVNNRSPGTCTDYRGALAGYVWTRAETFAAELCLANYGRQDFPHPCMQWTLTRLDGIEIASGKTECAADSRVNPVRVGTIQIPLQNVTCPQQLQLTVTLQGTDYRNR